MLHHVTCYRFEGGDNSLRCDETQISRLQRYTKTSADAVVRVDSIKQSNNQAINETINQPLYNDRSKEVGFFAHVYACK